MLCHPTVQAMMGDCHDRHLQLVLDRVMLPIIQNIDGELV